MCISIGSPDEVVEAKPSIIMTSKLASSLIMLYSSALRTAWTSPESSSTVVVSPSRAGKAKKVFSAKRKIWRRPEDYSDLLMITAPSPSG